MRRALQAPEIAAMTCRRVLRLLIDSVTITETGIDLELRANGIDSLLAEMGIESGDNYH